MPQLLAHTRLLARRTQREVMWQYGVSASEINAFPGRVISQFLCLKFQKFYVFESIDVNGKVCVPETPMSPETLCPGNLALLQLTLGKAFFIF